jgi:dTMP kinase
LSGYFITLEGIDGSGKTTQAHMLEKKLKSLGRKVILTREPGGVKGAEEIRDLLVQGSTDRWSSITETLLFFAARRHHLEQRILPALESGTIVVCDRFSDSTMVYQGREDPKIQELIGNLGQLAIGLEPNLTLIIDIDPVKSLNRGLKRKSNESRFELFGLEFQKKAKLKYQSLAKTLNRCHLIDGNDTIEKTHQIVWKTVANYLGLKD